jgi:dihydropteroate synthase
MNSRGESIGRRNHSGSAMTMRALYIKTVEDAVRELNRIGADEYSVDIMAPKTLGRTIKLEDVSSPAANILKQEMLSLGGDAAVARDVITGKAKTSSVLLMGTLKQLRNLVEKISRQPFGLAAISLRLSVLLDDIQSPPDLIVDCRGHILDLGSRTHIMGILNVTPDSFSDGGRFLDARQAAERAGQMVEEGADIIDIGGESTRPGSLGITADEELARIMPVLEKIVSGLGVPVSVDTCKGMVARAALEAGAHLINDISGLAHDPEMASIASRYEAPLVLMHIKGRPRDMQDNPAYHDLISEIYASLEKSVEKARQAGIDKEHLIVDPGIGFGKTAQHNLEILSHLQEFASLGYPLLLGISRKNFIGKTLDLPVGDRLEGSLAAAAVAILHGAHILRVHDVQASVRVARMVDAIGRANNVPQPIAGEKREEPWTMTP